VLTTQRIRCAVVAMAACAAPFCAPGQPGVVSVQEPPSAAMHSTTVKGFKAAGLAAEVQSAVRDGFPALQLSVRTATASFDADLPSLSGDEVRLVGPVAVVLEFVGQGAVISPEGRWVFFQPLRTLHLAQLSSHLRPCATVHAALRASASVSNRAA
jgi:hypothetical protein